MAENARRFVKALEQDRAGTLNSVNRILRERSLEIHPRDWIDHTDAEAALTKDVSGFEVIVHESYHLAGPQGAGQLARESMAIDEVTTEMSARKYMRDKVGVRYPVQKDVNCSSSLAYEVWTEQTRNVIKDVMDVDNETANTMLEKASLHFKAQKGKLTKVWEARKLFSEAFGNKAKEIADAIHRTEFEDP